MFADLPILYNLFVTLSLLTVFSWPFMDVHRMGKYSSCPTPTFPAEVEQGDALPSGFSSHTVHSVLSVIYVVPCFLHSCAFLLVNLLFKMTPKRRAAALSSASKCQKAVMCLTEKMCVFHKASFRRALPYCWPEVQCW